MNKKTLKIILAYIPAFIFNFAYITFHYLNQNYIINITPSQTVRTMVFLNLCLILFALIVHILVKEHVKAGLILWIVAVLFLFSQTFFIISGGITLVTVLVWVGITQLRKKPITLNFISFLLSVLGVGLIVLVPILDHTPFRLYAQGMPQILEPPIAELVVSESSPDIYYIVLDAYGRGDVLEELFGYDNSSFTDYLIDVGFIIPTANHSNYDRSESAEAATLNMQYIQALIPDAEGWPHWAMAPLIESSSVKTMLREEGYQTISIEVDFEGINDENVDRYYAPYPIRLNAFEKYLIQSSPLKLFSPIFRQFALLNTYSSHRELINYSFSTLSEIPEIDGPKFIYSHIISPHPPFVFDKNGAAIEPSYEYSFLDGVDYPESEEEYKTGYIEQLKYVNQQLQKVIASILEESETPPIIIIMGDHGSRLYSDFSDPDNACISESFSNFMALYLPGMEADEIPFDITSINVFRLIFDHYFQTDFGLLDNKYYFFSNEGIPFNFKDVGQSLNIECDVTP